MTGSNKVHGELGIFEDEAGWRKRERGKKKKERARGGREKRRDRIAGYRTLKRIGIEIWKRRGKSTDCSLQG